MSEQKPQIPQRARPTIDDIELALHRHQRAIEGIFGTLITEIRALAEKVKDKDDTTQKSD